MKFQKGHLPWNTGKKFSEELRMKLRLSHLGYKIPEETKLKMSLAHKLRGSMVGEKNPHWNGGQTVVKGYKKVLVKNHPNRQSEDYVMEHRLIMEKYLGRYLEPNEAIHHINGNKLDNRIENLKLFKDNQEHLAFHRQMDCGDKLVKEVI